MRDGTGCTYANNDREPDLSSNEEVGAMTEKGLDDRRIDSIEEGAGRKDSAICQLGLLSYLEGCEN